MWLFDRNAEREEQAKQKRWMQQFATPDPDDSDPPLEAGVRERDRRYRCRICAREELNARYCLTCLADTMVPLPRTGA